VHARQVPLKAVVTRRVAERIGAAACAELLAEPDMDGTQGLVAVDACILAQAAIAVVGRGRGRAGLQPLLVGTKESKEMIRHEGLS